MQVENFFFFNKSKEKKNTQETQPIIFLTLKNENEIKFSLTHQCALTAVTKTKQNNNHKYTSSVHSGTFLNKMTGTPGTSAYTHFAVTHFARHSSTKVSIDILQQNKLWYTVMISSRTSSSNLPSLSTKTPSTFFWVVVV